MTRFAVDSPAVAHGLGLFETMLVVGGQVSHCDAHFARMAASAAALGFPPPDPRRFRSAVARAARSVSGEAALRCVYAEDVGGWKLAVTPFAIPATTLRRREGARVITLDRSLTRSLPEHKMTSYAVCTLGLRQAVAAGADEALFVDSEGRVLEGTSTNVFAVSEDALITASEGILPGIVRASVLARATRVIFRPPAIEELREGSFLTSSLTGIAPIVSIDGVPTERRRLAG